MQITASKQRQFDDAFILYAVDDDQVYNSRFVSGSTPYMAKYIADRSKGELSTYDATMVQVALTELGQFMFVNELRYVNLSNKRLCLTVAAAKRSARNCCATLAALSCSST